MSGDCLLLVLVTATSLLLSDKLLCLAMENTYGVLGLLVLIAFLVSSGLLLIRLALLLGERLPLITEDLTDLTWNYCQSVVIQR